MFNYIPGEEVDLGEGSRESKQERRGDEGEVHFREYVEGSERE
jgi:hypothetical protein